MTASERLRAMEKGHGDVLVPNGVLRDIANQIDRENNYKNSDFYNLENKIASKNERDVCRIQAQPMA